MQPLTLINGSATRTLASSDRGLAYGQGVFTTLRVRQGKIELWEAHLARLTEGARRLGFPIHNLEKLLKREIGILPKEDLVIKIILTAGSGPRGYATPSELNPVRIIQIAPAPAVVEHPEGVRLRWCQTRLARQPLLAGLKHLNRLEQVLARSEWSDPDIFEGVMLDTEGAVIECTYSNLFWRKGESLFTPDLSFSGVRGVMRDTLINLAKMHQIELKEGWYQPSDLYGADAVFLCNALIGMVPVKSLEETEFGLPEQGDPIDRLNRALIEVLGDTRT